MKKSARKKKGMFDSGPKIPLVSDLPPIDASKKKSMISKPMIVGAFVVLFVALGALGVYMFVSSRENVVVPNTANLEGSQVRQMLDDVARLIEVPKNEVPTIAYVSDATTLNSQPFFKNAQNGDRVLVYQSTKQALLYRSTTNKIISAAIITDQELEAFLSLGKSKEREGTQSADLAVTTTPAPKIRTVVLNSTKEAGLARKGGALLSDEKYELVRTANAEGEYEKTVVVNVSKADYVTDAVLKDIATSFTDITATIGPLPADEAAPAGVDVVVILGSDFSTAY